MFVSATIFARLPSRHLFSARRLATLAQEVRSDATFHVPIVNFARFRDSQTQQERQAVSDDVVTAFKEVGFVYLSGHGISKDVIANVFSKSGQFFALPMEKKVALAWEDPRSNRGYVQPGRERVTQSSDPAEIAALRAKAPDYKETMEIGRVWDSTWKNQWPSEAHVPGFKDTMLAFFETCHQLHAQVMQSVALGLGLDQQFFTDKINEQTHNLRLLEYPETPRSLLETEGTSRAGPHSDYGTLTLLFQDAVGGLEVQNPHTKRYHAATPIPDTIVLNVGDLLQRWSSDTLRSTLHRVVAASGSGPMTPRRQSIAFFCNPNMTATIECLPTCRDASGKSKYEPINTEDYIVSRLTDTYS